MSIEKKLSELVKLLQEGPILPGGIKESYGKCGKANCKCKRKNNPELHGPYYVLSFSLKEGSSSMSILKKDVKLAQEMVERFQKAKSLLNELSLNYVEQGRGNKISELEAPNLEIKKKTIKDIAYKNKSKEQSKKLELSRIKIKNLSRNLETSKKKSNNLKDENKTLKLEVNSLQKKIIKLEKKQQLETNNDILEKKH